MIQAEAFVEFIYGFVHSIISINLEVTFITYFLRRVYV